jgi:hypothetical protein
MDLEAEIMWVYALYCFENPLSPQISKVYLQGGATNRGLLFVGPLLPLLGGPVSGEISEICYVAAQATLSIWGRRWVTVNYDVLSLAANSSLKALHETDLSRRSARPLAPVAASFL